jgi:hypothetical protein
VWSPLPSLSIHTTKPNLSAPSLTIWLAVAISWLAAKTARPSNNFHGAASLPCTHIHAAIMSCTCRQTLCMHATL